MRHAAGRSKAWKMLPAAPLWLEFHRLRSTPKGEEERSVEVHAVPKVPTTRKFLLMLEGCFVVGDWRLGLQAPGVRALSRPGGEGSAQSPGGPSLDGSPVPLGSTAAHEPAPTPRGVRARWESLAQQINT